MDPSLLTELLQCELNPHERKLEDALIREVATKARLRVPVAAGEGPAVEDERDRVALGLQVHLRERVEATYESIRSLRRLDSDFNVAYGRASSEESRRQLLLGFCRDLGATRAGLRRDARAFSRWFALDAVKDRYQRRLDRAQRELAFLLGRFGMLTARVVERAGDPDRLWGRLRAEETLKPLLAYEGDPRVACAAFRSLARALRALPRRLRQRGVGKSTLQYIYRSAMQARQDIWIQCEALDLLESLSPDSLQRVLVKRLAEPAEGDDLFLRRRAVRLLGRNLRALAGLEESIPTALGDPSPFVRQGLAAALAAAAAIEPAREALGRLAREDEEPAVRAAALIECGRLAGSEDDALSELGFRSLLDGLAGERDDFATRVAIEAAVAAIGLMAERRHPELARRAATLFSALERIHSGAESLLLRRSAAMARERIWFATEPEAAWLWRALPRFDDTRASGDEERVSRLVIDRHDDDLIGRVLSVAAQESHGFDLCRRRGKAILVRGHCFGFRAWRWLHELRHPSPDKRPAYPHTIGRIFHGEIRAPSAILCELAETKVPGEPLHMEEEQGWRPYLPLVDDLLGALDQAFHARPVRIYSSEGVTVLTPPATVRRRLRAYAAITRRFPELARLRNWRGSDDGSPRAYLEAVRELGFEVSFRPHPDLQGRPSDADPSVARFFPAALPLFDSEFWSQLRNYFSSVYENTLFELGLFGGVMALGFCARHMISNVTLRKARDSIPLVIGGWGTRGKSGTERLKAALFSALGYGFVSKTTGCEAMFLFAHPYGRTREMFLFRPYDKATIWEQRDVVRLARDLGTDVFLWECMGLTPDYVRILQRQWMRDDISTITNTYPDHEDLQGPAGIDIPRVMCDFIPRDGTLLTSEEQMLPILIEGAARRNTRSISVGWLQAGLLPPDILARFPYQEHPYNIALVLAMAEELGIDQGFALKEMADRVVPDIGVLKTYPVAEVLRRRLEFTNGMSANERHGCLGNWTRLGFDRHDFAEDPGTWICTVVNNRADRIARSRVFAEILARDLEVDRHVLIGNNLEGLRGYLEEAWEAHVAKLSLWREREDGSREDPRRVLEELARRMRVPVSSEAVVARLRALLEHQARAVEVEALAATWDDPPALRDRLVQAGLALDTDSILEHVEHWRRTLREYRELAERLGSAGEAEREALDRELREKLGKWFWWKIVTVDDYFASGDDVIEAVASALPAGAFCRIMGVQNIKGIGLRFVYAWQSWAQCHAACVKLRGQDLRAMDEGLKALAAQRDFGVLSEGFARETLEVVRRAPAAQRESVQAELAVIERNLNRARGDGAGRRGPGGGRGRKGRVARILARACEMVEEFLDAQDAIRRRKTANAIYRDLVAERISIDRAASELQALNQRQKGGWLLDRFEKLRRGLARRGAVLGPKA